MHRHLLLPSLLAVLCLSLPAQARAEDAPGVFKVPGTDSTIKFYGYTQLDLTLDLGARVGDIENNDWATLLPAVPADGSVDEKHKKPQLYMTARTSRFGVQTSTPTKLGAVGVRLEGDFNGPNGFQSETFTNSVLFRLRHGYGTIGGLLVGQTWTTFLDFGAAPDTVDFNGPGTLALVRNPMIRYTFDFGGGTTLALAAENARGAQFGGTKFQSVPDFHANLGFSGSWGSVSIRGVTQYFRETPTQTVGTVTTVLDVDPKSKFGVAGALSGGLKLGADTVNFQFAGGPGIGRYLLNALGTGASGAGAYTFNSAGDLELWTVLGAHAAFTHVWSPEYRSSLVAAGTWIVDPDKNGVSAVASGAEKQLLQGFVNTFWTFAKNAEFGIEFAAGQWKSFSSATSPEVKGTQYRVNSSFHYNFF